MMNCVEQKETFRKLKIEYDNFFKGIYVPDRKYAGDNYANGIIMSNENTQEYIYSKLKSNEPFMVSRFGGNELSAMVSGLSDKYPFHLWARHKKNNELYGIFNGAGFFPHDVNLMPKFADLMADSCQEIDLIGVWYNQYEEQAVKSLMKHDVKLCELGSLEPYGCETATPWSAGLKSKKVLVIHPFAQSIARQYEKRALLFKNPEILPEMELHLMKAVQTIAGEKDKRFASWFDALDYMHEESRKVDFDVAILGCGAYGMPLAARIKKDGKQAIHLGGATQLLFGIKGKRWEEQEFFVNNIFNEHWINPSDEEKPGKLNNVEGGCYW